MWISVRPTLNPDGSRHQEIHQEVGRVFISLAVKALTKAANQVLILETGVRVVGARIDNCCLPRQTGSCAEGRWAMRCPGRSAGGRCHGKLNTKIG